MEVIDTRIETEVTKRITEMSESGMVIMPCFLCGAMVQVREGTRGLNYACNCGFQGFVRGKAIDLLYEYIHFAITEKVKEDIQQGLRHNLRSSTKWPVNTTKPGA
jgi:predicted RNA-binding Zn-ribbon protein involved in translation (DUF1610 family)